MRAIFNLSIAAVAIALLVSGTAFAGSVENGSDAKVSVNGIIWTGIGYVTGFEDAGGNAPTSSFDVNNETRLNVAWTSGAFTGHWEYWMRNDIGRAHNVIGGGGTSVGVDAANDATGDEIMGWLTWKPMEGSMQIDVGQLEDQGWMERSVDWDMHAGTMYMPGATPGAYLGFPEDTPGVDIAFNAGAITAGLAVYAKGVVSGAANDQKQSSAYTFIPHVTFNSDFLWIAAYYESESATAAAPVTDADGNVTGYDWGSTSDVSNSLIGVSANVKLGIGSLKVQILLRDGDSFTDPQTDFALSYRQFIGDDTASIEYDNFDSGVSGADPQTWIRIAYKMGMGKNNNLQFEYAMSDDGNSQSSRPAATWITSF
jgi:hypothetical protein